LCLTPRAPPSGLSTSANTAANPAVTALVPPPGTKKVTSVIVLPTGANNRAGLNALKVFVSDGLWKVSARPAGGACTKPVPGVSITAPRLLRNTVNGVGPGEVAVEPPPSQLISRRPVAMGPAALPLLTPPIAARNSSTDD